MDSQKFSEGLAQLRGLRDDIKKAESALAKLHGRRERQIKAVAAYEKAKADRIAPAAGLSVKDITDLAPHLAPPPAATQPGLGPAAAQPPAAAAVAGAPAPALTPVASHGQPTLAPAFAPAPGVPAHDASSSVSAPAPVHAPPTPTTPALTPAAGHQPAAVPVPEPPAVAAADEAAPAVPAPDAGPGAAAPATVPAPADDPAVVTSGPDLAAAAPATAPAESEPQHQEPPAVAAANPAPPAVPAVPAAGAGRELPTIPAGGDGDRWFTVAADNLRSTRPKYPQQVRPMVFLDATTGDLIHRGQRVRLDLGHRSADEILTAVFAHVPDTVECIYLTAGDPWHRDAARYPYLRDAVRAWLDAPMPSGWTAETRRGKDSMAGHFIHERNPVGRWQRGNSHVQIRNVAEWFDPDGADVAVVRHAFTLLWEGLKKEWPDVVLMGSPSQTGRDLWTRTIPTKAGARWIDGYPVMSDEIRQLLHATSGQGRTELITPPRVPAQLPQLHEFDRTLAYGKHTWTSGVGAPQRVTARAFASWSAKEQSNALFAPGHWQVKVTIPDGWNHVGILPFAIEGEKAWSYPHEAGRTFTTWCGGAEVNLALRNPLVPWKVEILDGLLWEAGTPLKDWSEKLKTIWGALEAAAALAGSDELRQSYKLASRAVRSILLYGIGSFAQRPTTTTGTVPAGRQDQIPPGGRILSMDGETITWERTRMSRNENAHPEWCTGVWSAARAALLSTRAKTADGTTTHVGALHLPAGSIVAFRTDAIYTTAAADWPYNGESGDYRLKGVLPYPVPAPTDEAEFSTLQSLGRAMLQEQQEQGQLR
ncbi:Mucin-19 [Streptomyces erythrochromogenes]|uniref:Mucin-19 n=1 Tax=Streptomyces erythrochromogenes TaxID=285574 RepID=UPI00341A359C